MAWFDPKELPVIPGGARGAKEMGTLPDFPMTSPFATRWDPMDGATSTTAPCGRIGEDAYGVWSTVHPFSLFVEMPELWGVHSDWAYGLCELSHSDREERSNFELEALATLISARQRKEMPKNGRPTTFS